MPTVPAFIKLAQSFPYKPKALTPKRTGLIPAGAYVGTNKQLIESIGGDLVTRLRNIYADLDQMNTCAIRLSYCLNRSGCDITRVARVRMFKGADGKYYMISADEMITYLHIRFGKGALIFDGSKKSDKEWRDGVKPPVEGIFGYDWQGRIADFGASGHVDIGKLPSADLNSLTEYGTGTYFMDGPMKVYFWGSH